MTERAERLVVDALAVYRLTRLVTTDEVTAPLRSKALDRWPPHRADGTPRWSYALTCDWCASIYVSAGAVAASKMFPRAWNLAAAVLAASAVTGLVSSRAE